MKDQEEFEPLLPPQFAEFELPLRDAQMKIAEIDQQIDNLPKDRGPRFELPPPGSDFMRPGAGGRAGMVQQLEGRKDGIRQGFNEKIKTKLENMEQKPARKVQETVDLHLSSNQYKNLSRSELKDAEEPKKSLDKSMDYADKLLSNERASYGYRAAQEFSQSLSSTRQADISTDKSPDKDLDNTPDIDMDED